MTMRGMSVKFANAELNGTLFPNGCAFDTNPANPDVFLGACILENMTLSTNLGAAGASMTVTIYDGIVLATQRNVVGGTTTTEQYRVIGGTGSPNVSVTDQGDPYVRVAPHAQITACRKIMDAQVFTLPVDNASLTVPLGLFIPMGCAIHVVNTDIAAETYSIYVNFVPLATGGSRKRLAYAQGSTTKLTNPTWDPAVSTNAPKVGLPAL